MATYKAAYWTDGNGVEILLTLTEHAKLSDKELAEEGLKEAKKIGLDLSYGNIVIGEWTE